jgi:periplasmic protein TonB
VRDLPADAVRDMSMPGLATPALADTAPGRVAQAESQPVGSPPPEQTAAAHSAQPEPNPPTAAVGPPTRTELPSIVVAHADRRLCPPALHPAALRERGIEGAVVLRVKVDVQGRPADVQVLAGSGWRLFDEAALQQVRACRFIPATQGGQAIDSWVEFPVRFALAG